ncbi:hypothetical protein ACVWXO_003645 [Bradyrhizobium sp. LM2.7]
MADIRQAVKPLDVATKRHDAAATNSPSGKCCDDFVSLLV